MSKLRELWDRIRAFFTPPVVIEPKPEDDKEQP
jgi:hypothetical protein